MLFNARLKIWIGQHLHWSSSVQGDKCAPLAAYKRSVRDLTLKHIGVGNCLRILIYLNIFRTKE
jgi:hypothetical protein